MRSRSEVNDTRHFGITDTGPAPMSSQHILLLLGCSSVLLGCCQNAGEITQDASIASKNRPPKISVKLADLAAMELRSRKPGKRDIYGIGYYLTIHCKQAGKSWAVDLSPHDCWCYGTSGTGDFKAFRSEPLHRAAVEFIRKEMPDYRRDLESFLAQVPSDTTRLELDRLLRSK
jgi:hypothetical protein